MPTLGDRIRKARLGSDYKTQQLLGDAIGVSRETISQWERNETVPELENLISLAKNTKKSLDWLCGLRTKEISEEAVQVSEVWDYMPENARTAMKSAVVAFVPKHHPEAS